MTDDKENFDINGFYRQLDPEMNRLKKLVVSQRVILGMLRMADKDRFTMSRMIGLPDQITIYGAYYSPLYKGWVVIIHSPDFDPLPEGVEPPAFMPEMGCLDAVKWDVAEGLWTLLDDIDSASDMYKPDTLKTYKQFYTHVMAKVSERAKYLESDGWNLYITGTMPTDARKDIPPGDERFHAIRKEEYNER